MLRSPDLFRTSKFRTYLATSRKPVTSDDLIVDHEKIGAKIANCINLAKSVLPRRTPVLQPMGLTSDVVVYQRQIKTTFQFQSGELPTDFQSPDCGQWQTPRKTL